MRLLKTGLTLGGAACIGWTLPNLVNSALPYYVAKDVVFYSLVLTVGITSFVIGYGIHRRAIFAWLLGCLFYTVLVAYFFWRTVMKLELNSYYLLLALIAVWPFVAFWWRYAKIYFGDKDDD